MATPSYTETGSKTTNQLTLDKTIFGLKPTSHELLKTVADSYLANGRVNLAVTKKRGQVRGGGRKPWRQKGLGRARAGSSRSPIWRGGGVTFGPSGLENYSKKINSKSNRLALRQALSLASQDDQLILVTKLPAKLIKTAQLSQFLDKVGAKGSICLVVDQKPIELIRASRNLPKLDLVNQSYLSAYHILTSDKLVITKPALEALSSRLKESK